MLNLKKLIEDISNASATAGDVVINISINTSDTDILEEPHTDFKVGDRVFICHIKSDGTGTKHTLGTVIETLQQDDKGWYTRVEGDNGCHYKTGLLLDEERLGSKIIEVL